MIAAELEGATFAGHTPTDIDTENARISMVTA